LIQLNSTKVPNVLLLCAILPRLFLQYFFDIAV